MKKQVVASQKCWTMQVLAFQKCWALQVLAFQNARQFKYGLSKMLGKASKSFSKRRNSKF